VAGKLRSRPARVAHGIRIPSNPDRDGGTGWIQQWGSPIEEIRKGDVVWILAGVKHWHGATSNTSMMHIAIQELLNGKAVEWMEKVTDEQYHR